MAYEFGEVDLRAKIKVRSPLKPEEIKKENNQDFIETSVGRIIFNDTLPKDFPFQNIFMNARKLEETLWQIIEHYGNEAAPEILDKMKDLGFEYSTLSGITWGMDDLIIPKEKEAIMREAEAELEEVNSHYKKGLFSREEKRNKVIEIWQRAKLKIEKVVPKALPENGPVFQIVDSGARGSWTQPVQMAGMKGLVINPAGQIIELPVKHSFKEGLDVLEYFISTHGARKGTADTSLRTSTAGYLTRRLVDVSHEIIITQEDCKDEEGIEAKRQDAEDIGQNFYFKISGKFALENIKGRESQGRVKTIVKKGEIIDRKAAALIIKSGVETLKLRSPLTCKSLRGVCQKCYGWDLGHNTLVKLGEAVGIVAAQAIGEPGTQLTMRTFHTGGIAGGGDITFGLPRVQEIFEAREPRGKAIMSHFDGKVVEVTPERVIKIESRVNQGDSISLLKSKGIKIKEKQILEYKAPAEMALWVKAGDFVMKGQQLCEGHLDLKELFKVVGVQEVQRYIIQEVQGIYVSQGAIIHDKHVEVVVRQMFSRLRIKDAGDSLFVSGEIVERASLLELNDDLKKAKKKPAQAVPILLGMSRVALTTDSFLSAASFQETSRVLIKAAIEGREDKLRGLKENVIIGKLIPAGTGFKK